jgi:hypothetical protein
MVYLLDPNTATAGSVDHTYLAQSIAERYPNVRLAQIPSRHREAREEFPFALLDARTGEVVKHLRESETNISFVYRWLYEHDTQARGVKEVYAKYLADKEKAKKAKEDVARERLHENLDVVNTMARSQLHTFRHGDRKFG